MRYLRQFRLMRHLAPMAVIAWSVAPAAGQVSPPSSSAEVDTWVKICLQDKAKKNTLCRTGYDVLSPDGRVLVQAILTESTTQKGRTLTVSFPTGVQITPGIEAKVDEGDGVKGIYGFCNVASCIAQVPVSDQFLTGMKAGKTLTINAVDQNEKPIVYSVPLTTLKAVHEGAALDAEGIKQREAAIARLSQESKRSTFEQLLEAQRKARAGE